MGLGTRLVLIDQRFGPLLVLHFTTGTSLRKVVVGHIRYMRVCMCVYLCMRVCVRACVCCMYVCMYVCVCMRVCACVVCMHACILYI